MRRCETLNAAKEEAERLGASFEAIHGKKRYMGHIKLNGKCKKIAISKHSTDPRVLANIRENVRHAVKEMSNV